MIERCYNPKSIVYYRYGERGITVCDEWRFNPNSFIDWAILNGYQDDLTIDRINNDLGYYPTNCRWVDMKTQSRNRSSNRMITWCGKTQCLQDWSVELNIPANTLGYRVTRWGVHDAFTTPYPASKSTRMKG
jgi:hypothetical protein